MKAENKTKNRYFQAIIYEDDPRHEEYLNNIQEKYQEVTWITHDKDILDADGNMAKPHIHIMWKVGENARGVKAVAKEIGIESNYIQGCKKIPFLRYLIHLDNPEKTQYTTEAVHGLLKEELEQIVKGNINEEKQLADITTQICNHKINSAKELMLYCINNASTYTMKKYSYILNAMIGENKDEYKRICEKKREERELRRKASTNLRNSTK